MKTNIKTILTALYLFPWGIQCLINNFMPLYIAALPFSGEKLVGQISATGAVVTLASQFVWTKIADKTNKKGKVLSASLFLLMCFCIPFLYDNMTKPLLFLSVILFYSCYMPHQPLIDTIAALSVHHTNRPFGYFRSFSSLGYGIMGLLFMILPKESPNMFFIYVIILALISFLFSVFIPETKTEKTKSEKSPVFTKDFILFIVYTFVLFVCSSALSTFFPVYFTQENGLNGSVSFFSFLVSAGTFIECGVMLLFQKISHKIKYRYAFLFISVSGILRSGIIFFAKNYLTASLSLIFSGVWFGLLWACATPYMSKILPSDKLASAQGIWTITAFGAATFTGTLSGGFIAEITGIKYLFMVITLILVLLTALNPVLFKRDE